MKRSTEIDYRARIDDAIAWLAAHRDEDVRPEQLARVASFSVHHFHRVFRGVSGESVMQCLRRLRLEAAAQRLRRTDASVIEIALASGFESHEGFTRAFKDHFGAPPSAWRKRPSARLRALVEKSALTLPDVEVRSVAAIDFVHAHQRGSFGDVGAAWASFVERAGRAGILGRDVQLLGRYPDDPDITPPDKVRFDVGVIATRRSIALPPGLRRDTIPAGTWAIAVHRGSYATLSETYLALVGGWCPRTSRALADRPCLELYRNTPVDTAEADLETEVWAPLAD